MHPIRYTALIRTFNSARTLPAVVASLRAQSLPPCAYVIVDSGSTDGTLACLPEGAVVHRYVGRRFNYSEAINQGLDHVATNYVLIISSHTSLKNSAALSYASNLLEADRDLGAAYFRGELADLRYERINTRNFDGFNGLWNTCALIKMPLLNKRRFRPEVFSAEDQEWASWLMRHEGKAVARISGAGFQYDNPNGSSRKKRLDEYASIATFTNRRLLEWPHLAALAYETLRPAPPVALGQRFFQLRLFLRLLTCRFSPHTARYSVSKDKRKA